MKGSKYLHEIYKKCTLNPSPFSARDPVNYNTWLCTLASSDNPRFATTHDELELLNGDTDDLACKRIVDYALERGAVNFNSMLSHAMYANNKKMSVLAESLGANNFSMLKESYDETREKINRKLFIL